MGLLSFLKRPAAAGDAGSLEGLRRRARRRLIGAAVLVVIGVVVLPLLFDTAPRPVAVDIPIEIPAKEKVAPLAAAGKPIASGTLSPASVPAAPRSEPVAPTVAPVEAPPVTEKTPEKAADKPAEPPAAVASTRSTAGDAARALAALEARPATAALKPPEAGARYVVQVGAFSEASSAREARQRVEKLGLKTYTQVVETSGGSRTRVRVGPFDERAEADRAASKIKQSGLPAAVLGL
ncbi:MAG TPA: SPOR domain-containing protein [Methylibium sp.]|nr:SPOR domain-containing protein [Methylibium sp.]